MRLALIPVLILAATAGMMEVVSQWGEGWEGGTPCNTQHFIRMISIIKFYETCNLFLVNEVVVKFGWKSFN